MLQSLLGSVTIPVLEYGYEIGLNWLGKFAQAIIEGIGIIGLGIIVFTLVLKAITLPFDIYQRVKMRKQNLIMKKMKPELEKLQKQYANDKQMYNQKMVELQKKNGIGVLSACLPMLISLVILIVAFQGFRSYSQYANLHLFSEMSREYNTAAIWEHTVDGVDYQLVPTEEEGIYTLTWEGAENPIENVQWETNATLNATLEANGIDCGDIVYTMTEKNEQVGEDTYEPHRYIEVSAKVSEENKGKYVYYRYDPFVSVVRAYRIDIERLYASESGIKEKVEEIRLASLETDKPLTEESACSAYVRSLGADRAAEYYNNHKPKFLWVGNVWYPDVSYNHPVPTYKQLTDSVSGKVTFHDEYDENDKHKKEPLTDVLKDYQYEYLTASLQKEQGAPNGYFVLIILSIGLMVVSQLITMKSSKESNQYQTVDGQGAKSQKMMLIIMPMIYAIFAFLYSAAFSIYMIMSSFFAICVTLLSNLILGAVFRKKEQEEFKEEHTQVPPWMRYGKDGNKSDKKGKRK